MYSCFPSVLRYRGYAGKSLTDCMQRYTSMADPHRTIEKKKKKDGSDTSYRLSPLLLNFLIERLRLRRTGFTPFGRYSVFTRRSGITVRIMATRDGRKCPPRVYNNRVQSQNSYERNLMSWVFDNHNMGFNTLCLLSVTNHILPNNFFYKKKYNRTLTNLNTIQLNWSKKNMPWTYYPSDSYKCFRNFNTINKYRLLL